MRRVLYIHGVFILSVANNRCFSYSNPLIQDRQIKTGTLFYNTVMDKDRIPNHRSGFNMNPGTEYGVYDLTLYHTSG